MIGCVSKNRDLPQDDLDEAGDKVVGVGGIFVRLHFVVTCHER